jgi:hypothetical protein
MTQKVIEIVGTSKESFAQARRALSYSSSCHWGLTLSCSPYKSHHCGSRNAVALRYLDQAQTGEAVSHNRGPVNVQWGSTKLMTFQLGTPHSRLNALYD